MVQGDPRLPDLRVSEPAGRVAQVPHPVDVSRQLLPPQTQRPAQLGARHTRAQVAELLRLILRQNQSLKRQLRDL